MAAWVWLPVPAFLLAVVVLWIADLRTVSEAPVLLVFLNFTFSTAVCLFIAVLAAITVQLTGTAGALLFGAGALVMGASSLAAALAGRHSPNVVATVHNAGMVAAGVLNLLGAERSLRPRRAVKTPAVAVSLAYVVALGFVALVTTLAAENLTPPFFVQGAGGTPARQVVVAAAVALFGAAAALLLSGSGSRDTFRRWYGLGLLLQAVGLVAILGQPSVGSPLGWVGRAAQYLGGVYLLVAVVAAATRSHRWALPTGLALRDAESEARELRETRARLAYVLEGSNDGYWDWDIPTGRVAFSGRWAEMLGHELTELAPTFTTWQGLVHPDDLGGAMAAVQSHLRGETPRYLCEHRVHHKDGRLVWILARGKVVERDASGTPIRMAGTHTDITERKRIEEELRRSVATYSAMARNYPGGAIGLFDHDLRYVLVDGLGTGVTGAALQELVGRTVLEIYPSPERERVAGAFREALAGRTTELEISLGGRVTEVRCGPVADTDGRVFQGIAISRDVTERRRDEDALRSALIQLKRHVTNTPLGLVEWDGAYRVTRFSPRAEEMFGWSSDEVLGKRVDEVPWVPEEDGPGVRAVMETMDGRTAPASVSRRRVRRKDGRVIHCEWYNSSLHGADGKLASVFSLVHDVTAQREAEEALRAREAHFRKLVSAFPIPLAFANARREILTINEKFTQVLGYTRDDIPTIDDWFRRAYPDEAYRTRVAEQWSERLRKAAGLGAEIPPLEFRVTCKDGTERTMAISGTPMGDNVLVVFLDVTESRALAAQLALASRLAAMGTLVAGVAHEINNPLAVEMAAQGLALELARSAREHRTQGTRLEMEAEIHLLDEVIEALEDAQAGGQRIARIVRDLAAFAHPDPRRTRVKLSSVVSEALRWLPGSLSEAASVLVEDRGAPEVMASPGQIEQVVVNLVTNAARSTPAGKHGTVVVRSGPGLPGMARLEVIDDGTGIEPGILDRIFEPFFTTRRVGEGRGTGLGLAVSHAIVSSHGGTITVTSVVGKGSTFRVELPAAPAGA